MTPPIKSPRVSSLGPPMSISGAPAPACGACPPERSASAGTDAGSLAKRSSALRRGDLGRCGHGQEDRATATTRQRDVPVRRAAHFQRPPSTDRHAATTPTPSSPIAQTATEMNVGRNDQEHRDVCRRGAPAGGLHRAASTSVGSVDEHEATITPTRYVTRLVSGRGQRCRPPPRPGPTGADRPSGDDQSRGHTTDVFGRAATRRAPRPRRRALPRGSARPSGTDTSSGRINWW